MNVFISIQGWIVHIETITHRAQALESYVMAFQYKVNGYNEQDNFVTQNLITPLSFSYI